MPRSTNTISNRESIWPLWMLLKSFLKVFIQCIDTAPVSPHSYGISTLRVDIQPCLVASMVLELAEGNVACSTVPSNERSTTSEYRRWWFKKGQSKNDSIEDTNTRITAVSYYCYYGSYCTHYYPPSTHYITHSNTILYNADHLDSEIPLCSGHRKSRESGHTSKRPRVPFGESPERRAL
jgi:hypothetical protein